MTKITGVSKLVCLLYIARFRAENRERLEQNQRAQFASTAASQWLSIRLQLIGVVMVTGVATVAVVEHTYSTVDAGMQACYSMHL